MNQYDIYSHHLRPVMSWYPKYIHAYYFQSFDLFQPDFTTSGIMASQLEKNGRIPGNIQKLMCHQFGDTFRPQRNSWFANFFIPNWSFTARPVRIYHPKRKQPFVGNESKTKTGKAGFNHQLNKYLYLAKDTGQFPKKLVSQFSFFRVYDRLLGCTLSFLPHK